MGRCKQSPKSKMDSITFDTCWALHLTFQNITQFTNDVEVFATSSVSDVVLFAVLTIVAAILLVSGFRLAKLFFFLTGFFVCFLASSVLISFVFNWAGWTSCIAATVVAVFFGLVGGSVTYKLYNLAVFCSGILCGCTLGYHLYLLVIQRLVDSSIAYYACLLVPAVICGVAALFFAKALLIWSTALLGGLGVVAGFCGLVLVHIDSRFMVVLQPMAFDKDTLHSPFAYGPLLVAILFSIAGGYFQTVYSKKRTVRLENGYEAFVHEYPRAESNLEGRSMA